MRGDLIDVAAEFGKQEGAFDVDMPRYSCHLFAGGGGGMLADIIGGETAPLCAVEIERYPQDILVRRFPGLPVWDDVTTFRDGNPDCADMFAILRRHRDELVIAGGFPCQDISCAGKGAGIRGERSGLWVEYARVVREIRPRFVFVENSAMLASRGLGRVLGDLAALGYDAVWGVLSAEGMGARHKRDRMWITAARADAIPDASGNGSQGGGA